MRHNRSTEVGFTLIEVLIVVAIIGVLALISGNRMMRAKMSAEEVSAIASLRNINSGQASFASSCGGGHFAIDLADLATPPSGSASAFISPDLATNGVRKSSYVFALARSGEAGTSDSPVPACNGGATPVSAYQVNADAVGYADGRYFASDKRGSIYEAMGGSLANPIPSTAAMLK